MKFSFDGIKRLVNKESPKEKEERATFLRTQAALRTPKILPITGSESASLERARVQDTGTVDTKEWTAEDEEVLATLLQKIENFEGELEELNRIEDSLPTRMSLSTRDVEADITANLVPTLEKNMNLLGVKVEATPEGNALNLEIRFKVRSKMTSHRLAVDGLIENMDDNSLSFKHRYSVGKNPKHMDEALQKIEPHIEQLLVKFVKDLENAHKRRVSSAQIINGEIEVAFDAKENTEN